MLDNLLNAVTLAAWVLFIFLLVFYALRGYQRGGVVEGARNLTRGRLVLVLLITLAITFLSASLVFIEPQEVGVVISVISRDGYREQPMRSGLHWVVPLAEQVVRYPIYWQNYTMSTEAVEGARTGNDSIASRTSDGQAVYLDSSIIYRIDPNEAIRVHIDFQNRYVEDFVRPIMRGIIRTEVSQFTADEVNSSKRKNLEGNLEELLREEFSRKGFVLDQFILRNIAFSPQYASAIEQKQIAEQARIQKEYEAEQIRKLAEGQRDKLSIEAEGKAKAIQAEGQAEANVVLLKAKAEAEALRLLAAALQQNKDLLTLRYIDKLAPGIRVMLVPNNNPYILPLPDLSQDLGIGMGTPEGPGGGTGTPLNPELTPAGLPTPTLTPTPTPTALP